MTPQWCFIHSPSLPPFSVPCPRVAHHRLGDQTWVVGVANPKADWTCKHFSPFRDKNISQQTLGNPHLLRQKVRGEAEIPISGLNDRWTAKPLVISDQSRLPFARSYFHLRANWSNWSDLHPPLRSTRDAAAHFNPEPFPPQRRVAQAPRRGRSDPGGMGRFRLSPV